MKLTLEPVLSLTAALEQDLEKMGVSSKDIQALDFEHKQQRLFTASFNGKHVAFVAFEGHDDVNYINRFLVHPATRRRGVGRFVAEQLLDRVSGRFEYKLDELQVEDIASAKLFFEACGITSLVK